MTLVRFDPFRELDRFQNEVNRLFEGADTDAPAHRQTGERPPRAWAPVVDIAQNENEIVLRAELPGMKREDIDLELTGDTLTLRGERRFENEGRRDDFVRVERSYGRFQRAFTLGVPVEHDQVHATYRDGILEVRLPRSEGSKPHKVQVNVG